MIIDTIVQIGSNKEAKKEIENGNLFVSNILHKYIFICKANGIYHFGSYDIDTGKDKGCVMSEYEIDNLFRELLKDSDYYIVPAIGTDVTTLINFKKDIVDYILKILKQVEIDYRRSQFCVIKWKT